MPRDLAGCIAGDELAVAGERDRLDRDAGLLRDLAHDRLMQGLACLDHAARQRVHAGARAFRAPRDQHAAVADDRGADGEKRPVRIHAGVGHAGPLAPLIPAKPPVAHFAGVSKDGECAILRDALRRTSG